MVVVLETSGMEQLAAHAWRIASSAKMPPHAKTATEATIGMEPHAAPALTTVSIAKMHPLVKFAAPGTTLMGPHAPHAFKTVYGATKPTLVKCASGSLNGTARLVCPSAGLAGTGMGQRVPNALITAWSAMQLPARPASWGIMPMGSSAKLARLIAGGVLRPIHAQSAACSTTGMAQHA